MQQPAIKFDDPQYWPAECSKCGWVGMSSEAAGGLQNADAGDYSDCVCPICIAPNGDYQSGHYILLNEMPKP